MTFGLLQPWNREPESRVEHINNIDDLNRVMAVESKITDEWYLKSYNYSRYIDIDGLDRICGIAKYIRIRHISGT